MSLNRQNVLLHRGDSSKDQWRIDVRSIGESSKAESVLLTISIKQSIRQDHLASRRLALLLISSLLATAPGLDGGLHKICNWIEMTKASGFGSVQSFSHIC